MFPNNPDTSQLKAPKGATSALGVSVHVTEGYGSAQKSVGDPSNKLYVVQPGQRINSVDLKLLPLAVYTSPDSEISYALSLKVSAPVTLQLSVKDIAGAIVLFTVKVTKMFFMDAEIHGYVITALTAEATVAINAVTN